MHHFAARDRSGHLDETRGSVEPDGLVPERSKVGQIAAGATAEVEQCEGGRTFDRAKERRVILGNVVGAGSLLKRLRRGVIVGERAGGEHFEFGRGE